MEILWAYKQTKTKAFFRDGNRKLVVTKTGNNRFSAVGDRINKILNWNLGENINLEEVEITFTPR